MLAAWHGGSLPAAHTCCLAACAFPSQVVESGVDFLVVRAAPSDRVTDRYGEQANVVVAPAGRLPNNLQISRTQVRCRG